MTSRPSTANGKTVAHALLIGIGGRIAPPPLPHHRTYGSVYGGSIGYATDPRPRMEVRARRDKHSTGPDSEPGSDSLATGRRGSRPLSPPTACLRPAAPVPQIVCGRFSTVSRTHSVRAF